MKKGQTLWIILIIISIIGLVVYASHKEAEQFNRFSKTKITWRDALWAEYRILPD
jgi:FtsZ-interacting cell division protein ZipA